jgi:hypothetical protein
MTIRIAKLVASTLTIVAVSWVMVGCGDDGGVTTTVPTNPPAPKTTADGKPMPPPTAGGQTKGAAPAK